MALNSFFHSNGIKLSILIIVIGHTTFCIVVVYTLDGRERYRPHHRRQLAQAPCSSLALAFCIAPS